MGSENQHETCHESRDTGHNCRHEIRYSDLRQFRERGDSTAEMESSQNKFGAASKTTPPVGTLLQDALTNNISQERDYVLVVSIVQRAGACLRQTWRTVGHGATSVIGDFFKTCPARDHVLRVAMADNHPIRCISRGAWGSFFGAKLTELAAAN